MSQPFVGQIIMFGGNFPPNGWALCAGQLMPISENETLFNLIGTTFGGDGQSTFGLPDLQGRVPIHQGQGGGLSNYVIGQKAGAENVTVITQQLPQHTHTLLSNTSGTGGTNQNPVSNAILSNVGISGGPTTPPLAFKAPGGTQVTIANSAVGQTGGSQPHNNIQPVIAVTYCISLFGIFPTQ